MNRMISCAYYALFGCDCQVKMLVRFGFEPNFQSRINKEKISDSQSTKLKRARQDLNLQVGSRHYA